MLVLHVANALQDTAPDRVAEILGGRLRVDVTQIYGAVQALAHIVNTYTR